MDEQQAIHRLKRGDIGGLETLVTAYQVKAIRTAYLVTRDPQLAQDVVQDVFLQVYHSIASFDASRPFEPWFMRSVVHAALKALQKTARQVSTEPAGESGAGLEKWLVDQEGVETQLEKAEFDRQLWQAMRELPPRQRAVIVQRYFLEMSEKEMALELGSPPGTIKWLLNAARERLRKLLGSERSAK